MEKDALDKVAEAAAPRIGPAEVALKEVAGELLEQFLNGSRITKQGPKVAPDGPAVALEHLSLGIAGGVARPLVGAADQRPRLRDTPEALAQALRLHDGYSSCERRAAEKARQSILPLPSGKKNGPVCHNTTSCRNRYVRGKGASQVSEAQQGEAPVK